jgi:hypothetical protein
MALPVTKEQSPKARSAKIVEVVVVKVSVPLPA